MLSAAPTMTTWTTSTPKGSTTQPSANYYNKDEHTLLSKSTHMMDLYMSTLDRDASKETKMPATTSVTCSTYHYYRGNINYFYQIHNTTYHTVDVESLMACMTSLCAVSLTIYGNSTSQIPTLLSC